MGQQILEEKQVFLPGPGGGNVSRRDCSILNYSVLDNLKAMRACCSVSGHCIELEKKAYIFRINSCQKSRMATNYENCVPISLSSLPVLKQNRQVAF